MGKTIHTELGVLEEIDNSQDAQALQQAQQFMNTGYVQRSISQEALDALRQANSPQGDQAGSGVQRDQAYTGNNANNVGYYLEPGLKFIIPLLTPFSNRMPRLPFTKTGKGIDEINLRTVLDYFGGSGPTVLGGILGQQGTPNRGSYAYKNLKFKAKQIAWSDLVMDEDIIYGESFVGDVLQMAQANLIPAWKQIEECWLLNSAEQMWTPPPPLVSAVPGGSLAGGTYWVIVTAYNTVGGSNSAGETLGTSIQKVVVDGSTNTAISITLFQLPQGIGVTGYNVYVGSGSSQPANSAMWKQGASNFAAAATPLQVAGLSKGNQTVQINSVVTSGTAYSSVVTANTNGTNLPYLSVDTNANSSGIPLTFDGAQALLYRNQGSLSSVGTGGLTPVITQPAANGLLTALDISNHLETMFENAHADPDDLWCGAKDQTSLTKIVASASNVRINLNADGGDDQGSLAIGYRVSKILNPITKKLINVRLAPYLMQGTLIFGSMELPQPALGVDGPPVRVGVNRELYSRVYLPDQSHQTQTTVTAFGNESFINQCLGFWGIINGIVGS